MANTQAPAAFIGGLFETHLNVTNLERSMHFYTNVLGLELGMKELERRIAFYWIGGRNQAMLGLWEKPQAQIIPQHFAFEVALADLDRAIASVTHHGIEVRNFFDAPTTTPTVFGWMPAASIYFDDPDGHLLEFLARLPGAPKPEIGIVALDEWKRAEDSVGM